MSSPEDKSAYLEAVRRGGNPEPIDLESASAPVEIAAAVRYLTGVLTEAQADEVVAVLTTLPESRELLVQVSHILRRLQALGLTEVVRIRGEDTLEGKVAAAWLEIESESLGALVQLRIAEARLSLSDLLTAAKSGALASPFIRMILQGPSESMRLVPAVYRGADDPGGLSIESAEVAENGELSVRVVAKPNQAVEWEGREVEVTMHVQLPVFLGSGSIHKGKLEIRIPDAGPILGRSAGPIDPSELLVAQAGSSTPESGLVILPLVGEDESVLEYPRLEEWPELNRGRLVAVVAFPHSFRLSHAGKALDIYFGLAPGQWQKVTRLTIGGEIEQYPLEIEWPEAAALTGRVPLSARYRLISPDSSP